MIKIVKHIKRVVFAFRVKRAIKKANAYRNLTKMNYLVVMYKGKPKVFSKQYLKYLQKKGVFKVPYQFIEAQAIHKTI